MNENVFIVLLTDNKDYNYAVKDYIKKFSGDGEACEPYDGIQALNNMISLMPINIAKDNDVYPMLKLLVSHVLASSSDRPLPESDSLKNAPADKKDYEKQAHDLSIRISNILYDLGVPVHIRGYQYLSEAIATAVNNPDALSYVTKELYPSIAKNHQTTPSNVERAIRHAINVTWSRGKTDAINKLFGHLMDGNKSKPTNSEFIALIAQKLYLEGRSNQ